jgi:hypothetical protein
MHTDEKTLEPAAPQDPQVLSDRREHVRQELEYRFRHRLRKNQLCPLLHLLIKYKLEADK